MRNKFDIIIIGGGACGLMAANELCKAGKKTAIIEATERFGGRIRTITDPSFDHPVEAGAEFIHGKMEQTKYLLKKTQTKYYKAEGEIWQHNGKNFFQQEDFIQGIDALEVQLKKVEEDISVRSFIDKYFAEEKWEALRSSVENYIEGYDAADLSRASTLAFKEDMLYGDDEQYRIEGGYNIIIDHLYQECLDKGCFFIPSEPVTHVTDHQQGILVKTSAGNEYLSSQIIITVSLGVLQKNMIRFTPALDDKTEAACKLGFGAVIKMIFHFKIPFWKENGLSGKFYLFSDELIPTWWNLSNGSSLTAWVGGPPAEKLQHYTNEELIESGIRSLSLLFDLPGSFIKDQLRNAWVTNWNKEPFCLGGYSYEVINGSRYKSILREPVNNKIFFAGEALQDAVETGTVEAALVSGKDTAQRILGSSE
jgi:monoamine oxidase